MDDILFLSSGALVADPQNFRRLFAVSLWNDSDCADLYFSKGGYSDQVDILQWDMGPHEPPDWNCSLQQELNIIHHDWL